LAIVDPYHHLWDKADQLLDLVPPSDHGFIDIFRHIPRYLLDELRAVSHQRATRWQSAALGGKEGPQATSAED
jgi:hypothetical protein